MGLFDYVKCKYPLPDSEFQDVIYQTKDTETQYLSHYEITEHGRLLDEDSEDVNFHGDLRIYTFDERRDEKNRWIEFIIRFIEGTVSKVTRILDEPTHPEFEPTLY